MGKRPIASKQLIEQDPITNIYGCIEFSILASKLACSKPNADLLNRTYIQYLSGLSSGLQQQVLLIQNGRTLSSIAETSLLQDVRLVILLWVDNTLLMLLGVRVVHALLTITPCLMQGSMIQDSLALSYILSNIRNICLNPTLTNEDIPHEMQQMLDMLESMEGLPDSAREAVRSFRDTVACKCYLNAKGCAQSCPCLERESRCTPLCAKHTGARHCFERQQPD